jgi:NPCBM/NEW2 domain
VEKHASLLVALGLACAGGLPVTEGGEETAPVFQLSAADGVVHRGPWSRLDDDGKITLKMDSFAVRQWVTLRRHKTPLPAHPAGKQIVFANGDCLPLMDGQRLHSAGNRLYFNTSKSFIVKARELVAPLPSIALVWLGGPDGAEEPDWLLRKLVASRPKKDIVLLRGGERVEGSVLSLGSEAGCEVDTGKLRTTFRWEQLSAIAFNSDLLYSKVPERPHYHLVLADGSRLGLATARLDREAKNLAGTTLWGDTVEIDWTAIVAVEVRGGAAVYLSDLKPQKYEHTPFVGTSWPLVRDGSVTGRALCLGESTFDKGLGLHAESRVSYALAGKYRWFEAWAGLDPQEGQGGRVRLRVLVDGRERDLGWNKELTLADGPLALRVDVVQAREIVLEVLFGPRGDVQAHVNWADARLIE